jgi:hypothetical protein
MTVFLPKQTPTLAFINAYCNKSQLVISYGVLVTSLCRYKKEFWSIRNSYIQMIIICVGIVGSTFLESIHLVDNNIYAKGPTDQVFYEFVWVLSIRFLLQMAFYLDCRI